MADRGLVRFSNAPTQHLLIKGRLLAVGLAVVLLSACAGDGPQLDDLKSVAESVLAGDDSSSGPLSVDEITRGLKEALATGSSGCGEPTGPVQRFQ